MFVLRGLFWLIVVALLMPRGPDLGFDVSRVRADLAASPAQLVYVDDMRGRFAAAREAVGDPIQAYREHFRDVLLKRLDGVRAELTAARPQPVQDNAMAAMREMGFFR